MQAGISTDQLFAEPFEPQWMRRQREYARQEEATRRNMCKTIVGRRTRAKHIQRTVQLGRRSRSNRKAWHPMPIVPATNKPIPYVQKPPNPKSSPFKNQWPEWYELNVFRRRKIRRKMTA